MELFSELYNCYYQVVARILEETSTESEIIEIAQTYGYEESGISIISHIVNGDWDLFTNSPAGYSSKLLHSPYFPITNLQKSWLKSLLADPRICLFLTDGQLEELQLALSNISPLYDPSDFYAFDQYADGDPVSSIAYRKHFQTILQGIKHKQALKISYYSGKGKELETVYLPCSLEYSQKDHKFRLYALYRRRSGRYRMDILNVGRILKVEETGFFEKESVSIDYYMEQIISKEPVVLEISTERNALERTMLHFSCYQKKVERCKDSNTYCCSIYYNTGMETELLIQILSFGPVLKVLGPETFLKQLRERVKKQQNLRINNINFN